MTASKPKSSWLALRKQLYTQVRAQVQMRLSSAAQETKLIEALTEKWLQRPFKNSDQRTFFRDLHQDQVIFLGDFHALRQSQRLHVKIAERLQRSSRVTLAVEFFESRHQDLVDQFMRGELEEELFLESIQWSSHWGFPWSHYKYILDWAKKKKVRVIALNQYHRSVSPKTLKQRDRHACRILQKWVPKEKKDKLLIIFGEYHLSDDGIPGLLDPFLKEQGLRSIRVFQNSESVYFRLAEKGLENSVDVVKFNSGGYCISSVPPWVKWQSYLLYLEKSEEESSDDAETIDYTDHVSQFVKLIAHELHWQIELAQISIFGADDPHLEKVVFYCLLPSELVVAKDFIRRNESFLLPSQGRGYLATPTVNQTAQLAAEYVHAQMCGRKKLYWNMPHDFIKFIWIQTAIYFGAKLINHKKKTDTLFDLKLRLAAEKDETRTKEALLLALRQKTHELLSQNVKGMSIVPYRARLKSSYFEASRLLGGMLGERLYNGFRHGKVQIGTLVQMLQHDLEDPKFAIFYEEMLEFIENLPLLFKSKREKL